MLLNKKLLLWLLLAFIQRTFSTEVVSVEEEQLRVQGLQRMQQSEQQEGRQDIQEQMHEQMMQIMKQQEEISERERQEEIEMLIREELWKDSLLPDAEDSEEPISINTEYVGLANQPPKLHDANKLIIPRNEYSPPPQAFATSFKKQAAASSQWGEFGCCRRAVGIQTRERQIDSRYVEIQTRQCSWNYCQECVDDMTYCRYLRDLQNACDDRSNYKGFMSRHCPVTCSWCSDPSATPTPATTRRTTTRRSYLRSTTRRTTTTTARPDPNLRRVQVSFNDLNSVYNYKFTTSTRAPRLPWKPISRSRHGGEVASFSLYARATGQFNMPVYFCKATQRNVEKWIVIRRPCYGGKLNESKVNINGGGFTYLVDQTHIRTAYDSPLIAKINSWRQDMTLYASSTPRANARLLYVANRGQAPWTSRISRNSPCCGYEKAVWRMYVPTSSSRPTTTPIRSTTASPTTTRRTPRVTTTRAPLGGPSSPFQRECLQYHNFFRAAHGLPPLQWDPSLAGTSQRWADFLLDAAPNHPYSVSSGVQRTRNWPHSDTGTRYRGRGVGENIAWDLSGEGSPAKESVLRWYAEIFDYDETRPTHSEPGRPIGHYTQMLWRSSTRIGCAVAVRNIPRGRFTQKSTYTVAHYSPAGNIHYSRPSQTRIEYNQNVPRPLPRTCTSHEGCSVHNNQRSRCMGFSDQMECGCSRTNAGVFGGRPRCTGTGGCMVVCKRPPSNGPVNYYFESECQGQTSCECIYTPRNGRAGAKCS